MSQWEGRGSRQSRGYGAAWDKLRIRILKRDKYLCQPCLRKARVTAATQVDHIRPKASGRPLYAARMPGSTDMDDPSNLQSICGPCHTAKTIKDAGGQPKVRHRIGHDGWPIGDDGWPIGE